MINMFKEMQIGHHEKANKTINPAGKPQTKVTYTNKGGADVIQYSEDSGPAEGQVLGFKGAGRIVVGEGYGLFGVHQTDTECKSSVDTPFSTPTGSNPSDMHNDKLLYTDPSTGVQMTVQSAVSLGLVKKGAEGYEEVKRKK